MIEILIFTHLFGSVIFGWVLAKVLLRFINLIIH
jgi:hypothetical protein